MPPPRSYSPGYSGGPFGQNQIQRGAQQNAQQSTPDDRSALNVPAPAPQPPAQQSVPDDRPVLNQPPAATTPSDQGDQGLGGPGD
jgi:hypothetical protein